MRGSPGSTASFREQTLQRTAKQPILPSWRVPRYHCRIFSSWKSTTFCKTGERVRFHCEIQWAVCVCGYQLPALSQGTSTSNLQCKEVKKKALGFAPQSPELGPSHAAAKPTSEAQLAWGGVGHIILWRGVPQTPPMHTCCRHRQPGRPLQAPAKTRKEAGCSSCLSWIRPRGPWLHSQREVAPPVQVSPRGRLASGYDWSSLACQSRVSQVAKGRCFQGASSAREGPPRPRPRRKGPRPLRPLSLHREPPASPHTGPTSHKTPPRPVTGPSSDLPAPPSLSTIGRDPHLPPSARQDSGRTPRPTLLATSDAANHKTAATFPASSARDKDGGSETRACAHEASCPTAEQRPPWPRPCPEPPLALRGRVQEARLATEWAGRLWHCRLLAGRDRPVSL